MFVYNPENNPSEITSDNSSMALGLGKQPYRKKKIHVDSAAAGSCCTCRVLLCVVGPVQKKVGFLLVDGHIVVT